MSETTLYEALENWKNREQNLVRLFSERSLQNRDFLKTKLDHFLELNDRYGRQKEMKNDLGLKVLRGEIKRLELHLYPKLAERLVRRAIVSIKFMFGPDRLLERERRRIEEDKERKIIQAALQPSAPEKKQARAAESVATERELNGMKSSLRKGREQGLSQAPVVPIQDRNFLQLNNQLRQLGFGDVFRKTLREKIRKDPLDFTLSMQKDRGEDSLRAVLYFRKSETGGQYELSKYKMELQNARHKVPIQQTFVTGNKETVITFDEGHNLLSGRAVYKESVNKHGEKYGAWLQLDFRDITGQGEYKMRQFHDNYGYDLRSVLQQYPIKGIDAPEKMKELIRSLQKGNQAAVTVELGGKDVKLSMEASPRFKSVNLYGSDRNRVYKHDLAERDRGVSQRQGVKQDAKQVADEEGESSIEPIAKKKKGRRIT